MADEFVTKSLLNDDGPVIIDITAHTHCYARPGTAWAFEEVIRKVSQRDDVWLTVREDLVTHYQQSRKR